MITGIKVHNFKSIHELPDLKFGDMNFIIGQNGVGKTNLLSAIELTRRLASGADIEEATTQIAPFTMELFTRGSNSSSTSITLNLKDRDNTRYEFAYTVSVSDRDLIITDEKLAQYEHNEFKEIYVRKDDSFTARDINTSSLKDVPLSVKKDELALANFSNETAIKIANMISSFKVLWFDRTAQQYTFRVHRRDSLDLSNLDGLAVSLHENKRELFDKAVSIVQQIIPEFTAPRISKISPPITKSSKDDEENKVLDRYIVYWGEKEVRDFSLTLSGLSDGNFRIIQLIFALFDSEDSSCVIGEEIENGQHYGRIKTLMEILKHLAIKLNVQLIFSTHSGEILNHIPVSDIIYCSKDAKGYSQYRKLTDVVDVGMVAKELGREPTTKELIDLGMV